MQAVSASLKSGIFQTVGHEPLVSSEVNLLAQTRIFKNWNRIEHYLVKKLVLQNMSVCSQEQVVNTILWKSTVGLLCGSDGL